MNIEKYTERARGFIQSAQTAALGKGHQAVQGTAYGTSKAAGGKVTMVNVKTYPASRVTPPDGVKTEDWIKSGFKNGK